MWLSQTRVLVVVLVLGLKVVVLSQRHPHDLRLMRRLVVLVLVLVQHLNRCLSSTIVDLTMLLLMETRLMSFHAQFYLLAGVDGVAVLTHEDSAPTEHLIVKSRIHVRATSKKITGTRMFVM
jgi:hypothetical protein